MSKHLSERIEACCNQIDKRLKKRKLDLSWRADQRNYIIRDEANRWDLKQDFMLRLLGSNEH